IKTPCVMRRTSLHSSWTEHEMRGPLDVSSGHTPAWRKLLLTDSLQLMPLKTFPAAIRGVIQSELNY
ncbi:IGSF23 isoform 2, partial [Pongo abelii]